MIILSLVFIFEDYILCSFILHPEPVTEYVVYV